MPPLSVKPISLTEACPQNVYGDAARGGTGGPTVYSNSDAAAAAVLQRIQQSAAAADSENTANGGWTGDFGFGIINAYNALNGTSRTATVGALTGQVIDLSKGI